MQSTSATFFSPSKLKYIVIMCFILVLGFIIFKMMQFEDSIREQRIIKVNVGGEKKKLIPEISIYDLQKKSENSVCDFKTGNKYFSILEKKIRDGENVKEWKQYFLKGVNMGVALPGNYPTEFKASYDIYLDWFKKIAEMNSNTIRIYTILPPEFYEAFAQYNIDHFSSPLYLLQGVWADETESNNYFEKEYTERFQKEIKDVIDVLHGNCVIPERRSHAAGTYARDVSQYTAGIILGREWEPVTVTTTNSKNNAVKNYNGNFISLPTGNPMEAWLAQSMDFTVQYETQIYGEQRPVSFVNWLPTDPMYHSSEFIENKKVREYDNDLEAIDFRKFYITNLFKAGIFASYHAYPYYPDFVFLDDKYKNSENAAGEKDNYYGYLKDLKEHCTGMPLLITEYGVPSSRGNSHYNPFGFDQGGHSEEDQAKVNKTLTEDIYNTGCGGAVYFEWMDEWFKINWLVIDFEVPADRRKLWHNLENPEQNFGILAVEQRTKTVDGLSGDWDQKEQISTRSNYVFSAGADAEYFYMKYKLPDFNFSNNNLHIAIDTYDKIKGSHKLPFLKENLDNGIEFLINFINPDSAEILVDKDYSVYSDIYDDFVPVYASKENYNADFVRQILLSNRGRETLTGEKTDRVVHDRSKLVFGKSNEYASSNSNWFWNENDKTLEVRLPWHLLNVSDPSSKNILNDIEGTPDIESIETDGFNIYSYLSDKKNENIKQIPENKPGFYSWAKWEKPDYTTRLKKVYYELRDLFRELDVKENPEEKAMSNNFKLTEWYKNKNGAVTVSFDDGSMTQYTNGVPVLDKYGIKATFAVVTEWMQDNPSSSSEKGNFSIEKFGWKQSRELVERGHEIASHNYYHIKLDTVTGSRALDMMKESKLITEKNTGKPVYTFVFPYSNSRKDLFPLTKEAGYLFSRVGEDMVNEKDNLDFTRLTTVAIYNEENPSPADFSNYLRKANNHWIILNYHHIFNPDSKEMNLLKYHKVTNTYSITPDMFERQMRLVRNTDYWIAPISLVGRYITQRDNTKLEISDHGNNIFLKLIDQLDKTIYDLPVTVEFTTSWRVVKITNSAEDGIYNPVENKIYINALPGKEILIENLSE
ncbi:MAG: polysaccharide deacetylase family protein [Ignavibacteria bacterium]